MNRTLVHGAFVLDEAGKSILLHDTLALAHLDVNEVQGTMTPSVWPWQNMPRN